MRGPASSGRALRPSFVCRSCIAQQLGRPFSFSASRRSQFPGEPPASGLAALSSRRLISVSGPDAAKYLQGVITSSIVNPAGGARDQGFYTAFLSAQGRVLHDVFIYPDSLGIGKNTTGGQGRGQLGESFLIEVDAAEAERLQKHIRRYKLRAKFDVRLLDGEEWTVWHAWDESGKVGLLGPHDRAGGGDEDTILLQDPRAPGLGCRVIAPGGRAPAIGVDASTEDAYHIRRYLQGVPEGQDELLHEQALPQESNMDVMGGIDFKKGCYVGQELTIRTKHRGVVRKRILPCVLYGEEQGIPERLAYQPFIGRDPGPGLFGAQMIPSGTSIGRAGKKGRSAGKWLKGVGNIGLALCRLEIMTDVVLPGETAAAAYSPDDEFVMQDKSADEDRIDKPVKIKAFVPAWLRRGLDGAHHAH